MPFRRLKVRVKKEIVTIGDTAVDPTAAVGRYVEPRDWNALIADPEVLVGRCPQRLRARLRHVRGRDRPGTGSFGDFPAYVRNRLAGEKSRTIAMFCTGGIRCEKATSLLLSEGFADVRHLKGGILRYLQEVPESESLWRGGCFVFDERVALGHGLTPSGLGLCLSCNAPVGPAERASPAYEEGVSCPACADVLTPERRRSARDRQRQMASQENAPDGVSGAPGSTASRR